MGFVEQLSQIDIATTPNYTVAKAIATHPKADFPDQAKVAFSIQVDVSEDFVKDEDFPKVIDAYVTTLNRIYAQLKKDIPADAHVIFRQMAKTMSLKYSF